MALATARVALCDRNLKNHKLQQTRASYPEIQDHQHPSVQLQICEARFRDFGCIGFMGSKALRYPL